MYLNVCASFSWDKEQNYIKWERKKKEDKLLGAREVCRFHKFQLSSFPCLLGSLSNDDGDGNENENGKKSTELDKQNNNFARAFHAFLYTSLPTLHDYDVKMTNFLFWRELERKATTFFFSSWSSIQSFRIQLRKICQHLTNWTRWDKHRKVWSNANSLFLKVTFSQPLPPLLRKLPIG